MALPVLLPVPEIHDRLQKIFPKGSPNRNNCTWEIAAKTVFVMLYVGAVEGADTWLSARSGHAHDRQTSRSHR